jgi:hypothetical protein
MDNEDPIPTELSTELAKPNPLLQTENPLPIRENARTERLDPTVVNDKVESLSAMRTVDLMLSDDPT